MSDNKTSMTFRVDAELQAAFAAACKASDVSAAQVLRAAMREFVNANAQTRLALQPSGKRKAGKE